MEKVIYDKKWKKFLKKIWLFRHIPFVYFLFAAGSLAAGNVKSTSDFDVIVGVQLGRIFTARFFCVLFFDLLGWRREKITHKEVASDKICFNHFVTEKSYRLSPPYNKSWQILYKNLVPVLGNLKDINIFFQANADWLGEKKEFQDDLRYQNKKPSFLKIFLEWLLKGFLGNRLEEILKYLQIKRIEKSLKFEPLYEPRIKYTDEELEFHPDCRLKYKE